MLEKILKLYVTYMAGDVRSPMPHLVGPPGCGKSTVIEQAAELLGVNLHVINVSRLSPLDVEGVQMPHGSGDDMVLKMLPATFWTSLKEGDIINFDEFLRGFPEVYNAILDILTSRRVGALHLPKVFILGASNSTVAYDPALEDRLLHLPVPDPRKRKGAKAELANLIIEGVGLYPKMAGSMEMQALLDTVVLPMFNVLDSFKPGMQASPTLVQGKSIRNLIGQARLREVQTSELSELIEENNRKACADGKPQFVVLISGKASTYTDAYSTYAPKLPKDKLTPQQLTNMQLNLQLLETETIRNQKEGPSSSDDTDEDDILSSF